MVTLANNQPENILKAKISTLVWGKTKIFLKIWEIGEQKREKQRRINKLSHTVGFWKRYRSFFSESTGDNIIIDSYEGEVIKLSEVLDRLESESWDIDQQIRNLVHQYLISTNKDGFDQLKNLIIQDENDPTLRKYSEKNLSDYRFEKESMINKLVIDTIGRCIKDIFRKK